MRLQSSAEAEGVTYADVLERAERQVDLNKLGLKDGMRIRRAATGARVLELPRGKSKESAEQLASELRLALEGMADVVHPTTCADVRLTGLDDSVTTSKLSAAIAHAANCSSEVVRVGEIQTGPAGVGMVKISCPLEVAKLLADAGKVLVGWSVAKVTVLEQRPLRCFKCMGLGHTSPLCPSKIFRGNLCYRCGEEGHRLSSCAGNLRCAVCADAGKPHKHVMGSRECRPPTMKGRMVQRTGITTAVEDHQAQKETNMES